MITMMLRLLQACAFDTHKLLELSIRRHTNYAEIISYYGGTIGNYAEIITMCS